MTKELCKHKALLTTVVSIVVFIAIVLLCFAVYRTQHKVDWKSTYTYVTYNSEQQRLYEYLYSALTPENTTITYKTTLSEHEIDEVLSDFLLYNPYSYWLLPDYVLFISDGTAYLNFTTDYTLEQQQVTDEQLTDAINDCIAYVTDTEYNTPDEVYAKLFSYLYTQVDILDGTYRAPIKCCLLDNACNCQGFAYTFLYICQQLGVYADIQYGNYYGANCVAWRVDSDKAANGELNITRSTAGHVWNVVNVDDTPYYIDIYVLKSKQDATTNYNITEEPLIFLTADELKELYYIW